MKFTPPLFKNKFEIINGFFCVIEPANADGEFKFNIAATFDETEISDGYKSFIDSILNSQYSSLNKNETGLYQDLNKVNSYIAAIAKKDKNYKTDDYIAIIKSNRNLYSEKAVEKYIKTKICPVIEQHNAQVYLSKDMVECFLDQYISNINPAFLNVEIEVDSVMYPFDVDKDTFLDVCAESIRNTYIIEEGLTNDDLIDILHEHLKEYINSIDKDALLNEYEK